MKIKKMFLLLMVFASLFFSSTLLVNAAAKGKLTVNYIDTRLGEAEPIIKTYNSDYQSSAIYMYSNLGLSSATANFINEVDADGNLTNYSYAFEGWYTADGTKLSYENYTSVDGVNFKIYNKSQVSSLSVQVPTLENNKEINLYAKWTKVYKPTVTIHIYDTKKFNENKEVRTKEVSLNLKSTQSSGRFDLDQLFTDSDPIYSGFSYDGIYPKNQMTNTVKLSNADANYYKFIKWMDENGTEINADYVDANGVISSVLVADKKIGNQNKKQTLEITFKSALDANLDKNIDIYIYADFEGHSSASLTNEYIDEVSTGSGSFSETSQGLIEYSHTFSDPSIKTPVEHYEFLYWQYEEPEQEDDQIDPTKEYKDGDKMTYNLFYKPESWAATIIAHAWWRADVTLNLYSDGELLSTQADFDSVSINVTPTKFGYKFLGWVDENGNLVTDTTFYPNEKGTNPDPKMVNLYASWEKIKIDVKVTKEWNDNNNSDGARPKTITVNLKNGDEVVASAELNEDNNWTYTFNVEKYDDEKEIEYSIEEIKVDKYDTVITGNMEDGFVITNTYNYNEKENQDESIEGVVAGESEENPPKTSVDGFNMFSLLSLIVMGMIIKIRETIK